VTKLSKKIFAEDRQGLKSRVLGGARQIFILSISNEFLHSEENGQLCSSKVLTFLNIMVAF